MRSIGIDLAIGAQRRAVVVDGRHNVVTPLLRVATDPANLDDLLRRARERANDGERLPPLM